MNSSSADVSPFLLSLASRPCGEQQCLCRFYALGAERTPFRTAGRTRHAREYVVPIIGSDEVYLRHSTYDESHVTVTGRSSHKLRCISGQPWRL